MPETAASSVSASPVLPQAPMATPVVTVAGGGAEKWDKVIRGLIYALTFLLPVLFTTWTFEPLEFSKQILLFVLAAGAVIAWLLKLMVLRQFRFVKTPLDLPIGVFLLVYLLASVFSVDRVASFLGFYGSFSGNFFQVLFLVVLFYLVVNNFQSRRHLTRLLGVLNFSAMLALVYAVLQFFGVFVLPFAFAKNAGFNTIGGLLMVSLFAAFSATVQLAMGSSSGSWFNFFTGKLWRILSLAAAFLVLLSINFIYAWAAVLVGLLVYMVFQMGLAKNFAMKNMVTPLVMLILVISFVIIQIVFPYVSFRSIVGDQALNLPVEVRLDYSTAMPVMKGVLTSRPVLGSGPGTFLYAFSQHRSQNFNLSPFWNVRFDKAPSEAAEYLTGTGILGFLVFEVLNAIFIFYALYYLSRRQDPENWRTALAFFSGFAVLWFSHWFFFFNTVMVFAYWLMIAGFVAATRAGAEEEESARFEFSLTDSPRRMVSAVSAVSLALVLVVVFLFFAFSVYAADIFYRAGLANSNKLETFDAAGSDFEQAIRLNRFRPDYFFTYSEFLFLRINQELAKKDPNPILIQQWLGNSINVSRAAVALSPNNWTAWERLANLYTNARPLVGGVDRFIIESLQKAVENDNKNPILFTELGQVYRLAARRVDPGILGKGVDSDEDGLSDEQEKVLGSNPEDPDTNANQTVDGNEVLAGLSPAGSGALPDSFLQQYVKTDKESLLKAEEAFRKAIELKSDYATAYYQLALTLDQQGKPDEAIAELEGALAKFPQNLTIKFQLGVMYYNNNKVELAARQFQELAQVAPNDGNVRFSLALSFERLGKMQRALLEFRRLLEANPQNEFLKQKVQQLEALPK